VVGGLIMGITSFSAELINKHFPGGRVCELGAQNLYIKESPAGWPYAHELYESLGAELYNCIDLNGENKAIIQDLSKPLDLEDSYVFDFVTNFGTSEHVSCLYNCFKNIHNLCVENGIIICENPKTGNWPGHGFHYMTEAFYIDLAAACGYEILEIGEHPAVGNVTDGWNIYCVMKKGKGKFMSKAKFEKLDYRTT
jgi:SAM-dependent methyltransferase